MLENQFDRCQSRDPKTNHQCEFAICHNVNEGWHYNNDIGEWEPTDEEIKKYKEMKEIIALDLDGKLSVLGSELEEIVEVFHKYDFTGREMITILEKYFPVGWLPSDIC